MVYAFLSYKDQFVTRIVSLIDNFVKFKMINLHLERISDIALTDIEKEKKVYDREGQPTDRIDIDYRSIYIYIYISGYYRGIYK